MRMHRFEGATMRDAIAKVKAELGDQAVIISTRQIRSGLLGTAVEISAAIEDSAETGTAHARTGPTTGGPTRMPRDTARETPRDTSPPENLEKLMAPLKSELRSLRAMVRAADSEPRAATEMKAELVALRKLVEDMSAATVAAAAATAAAKAAPAPAPAPAPPVAVEAAPVAAAPAPRPRSRLEQAIDDVAPIAAAALELEFDRELDLDRLDRLQAAQDAAPVTAPLTAPSRGRILMLVGPTGAGKTTTIAKLAANAALVDRKRVRLITLDNFRVGGIEQIRTFADLIGVPLDVAESPAHLADLLDPDIELTLIDTAGRSPRDTSSIIELAAELSSLPPIEVHLVVPAAASAAAIDELANRYRPLNPVRLLFTKLDEIDHAPQLAQAPARTRLPVTWVTTGQAVPEDIEQPSSSRLCALATSGLSPALPLGRSTRVRSHRAAESQARHD